MKPQPTHPLSILFDLASTLAVPRISRHIAKLMWPVLRGEELNEMEALTEQISQTRAFECEHERWPFQAGAGKVISILRTIAAMEGKDDAWKDLTICYAGEYFLELTFQRFFALAVYEMAKDTAEREEAHFHYRNGYANARAVLAMPLLVDLARKTEIVIGQGNFGYKPSRNLPWVYPHLSHYLSAFYYPWVPNLDMPAVRPESAIVRAITRSQRICRELFNLLRNGHALRRRTDPIGPIELVRRVEILELEEVVLLFEESPDNRIKISPFVKEVITRGNFRDFLKSAKTYTPGSSEFENAVLSDAEINQKVSNYLATTKSGRQSTYEKLLQTCRHNLNAAVRREIDQLDSQQDFIAFDRDEIGKYLTWRFLEERLRIFIDRLLLHRRFYDPPLTRSRFSSKFENLGLFAVEVPEVNLNLYVEDFNNGGESISKPEQPKNAGQIECEQWVAAARALYKTDKASLWAHGRFPYHALFETLLDDEDPDSHFGPFWMALLLSHVVPPTTAANDQTRQKARDMFGLRVLERWQGQLTTITPFTALSAILEQKQSERKRDPETYGEECQLWIWLDKKLTDLCRQELQKPWSEVTLQEMMDRIFVKVPQPWVYPPETTGAKLKETQNAEELEEQVTTLLKVKNEEWELEERGQLFFSYSAFFGVNTTIFRALTDLGFARNFLTIRLIATERTTAAIASSENQDHADFVGTYTVWNKGNTYELPIGDNRSYKARRDAWREDGISGSTKGSGSGPVWLAELHCLKLLVKSLGISLLNQERIKEQERLNTLLRKETARSTMAGIMARNMSHNIGSHVLASSGLLDGVDISEIQKLHNFLQQRMDFIAQVVTYTPSWGEPMFFFKDLLGEFFNQYLLLSNLIKDQGYPEITFYVSIDGRKELVFARTTCCSQCKEEWKEGNGARKCNCKGSALIGGWQLRQEEKDEPLDEFLVAVPGGAIGAHAFYVILENMLRNSAKYGNQQGHTEGLQVHIEVIDKDDRRYINVWDNSGRRDGHKPDKPESCGCRICVVQRRLEDELIDPVTGVVTEKSRGIHEMKECAAILISPHVDELGELIDSKKLALWAGARKHGDDEYLQYGMVLQKPRLVGVVDSAGKACPEAKSVGVFHYTDVDNLARYPHQLGLIYLRPDSRDDLLKYIEEHHYLLPHRLIVVDKTGTPNTTLNLHPRRVKWCDIDAPGSETKAAWEAFVIELWETWLRRFKNSDDSRWRLMVSFERNEGHSAFTRWKHALKSFESDLVKVFLTRGRDHTFATVEDPPNMSRAELAREIEARESSWIIFDNHGTGFNYRDGSETKPFGERSRLKAYHDFGSRESIRLYQTLESPPSSTFGFALFILGLLESSLLNVVVIDERVADAIYDKEVGFRNGLMEHLITANCFPIFSLWMGPADDPGSTRKFVSETIRQRSEAAKSSEDEYVLEREGVELAEPPHVRVHVPGGDDDPSIREIAATQVDTIIIHQGVIDVLQQNNLWRGEGHGDYHLKVLHQLSPSVIITSGRGRTIRHIGNKEIPFVEFSIIKDNTYAGLSKYHLVRSLLSVAGEKRTVEQS
jgi:hypothetical protein